MTVAPKWHCTSCIGTVSAGGSIAICLRYRHSRGGCQFPTHTPPMLHYIAWTFKDWCFAKYLEIYCEHPHFLMGCPGPYQENPRHSHLTQAAQPSHLNAPRKTARRPASAPAAGNPPDERVCQTPGPGAHLVSCQLPCRVSADHVRDIHAC